MRLSEIEHAHVGGQKSVVLRFLAAPMDANVRGYVGGGKIFGNDYGCSANGVYGCVGFADVHTPAGSVTWALPKQAFDLGGMPAAAA